MQPEQATFLRDFFAQGLEEEAKTTRRVLAAVPDANRDYRPDTRSRTGFELAWHIASSDAWFLEGILAGAFQLEGDAGTQVPPEIKTVADVVAYYDQNYLAKLPRVRSLGGEALAKVVDFLGMFHSPRAAYLGFLNNHQIHHRGQLCAYLRAMGAKVPNIYGGSADEPMQMEAGA